MHKNALSKRVFRDPVYFIGFGFGSGLISVAPGTFGTLAGIPVYLLIVNMHWSLYATFTLVALILGIWISDIISKDLGEHDYPGIVWDEVVGYLLTMFLVPLAWQWMLLGFILFRLFDIWKPWPIRYVNDHVQGGLGVMLDDVLAAIPSWIILQIVVWSFR